MSRVWTVARRELKALFDQPTGYILLIVFLAINDFLFFRQAYLNGAGSLRPMLDLLPWEFLFFVPAVAMRALAEDSRTGLLEVVLAQPLTELELLFGKYLGAVLFLWMALGLTLPIPLGLALGAHLQWGVILAQYVGAALLAAGLAAVGVWASSLTRSQITAFIVAVGVMFGLILVGLDPLLVGLPPGLGTIAARIGVLSHFDNIGRGVIDLRDAVYFLSLSAVFLVLAYQALLIRRLAPRGGAVKRLRLGTALLVAMLVVVNLLGGYIGGRLDLTPGRTYTLSPATKELVGRLDDLVTIKVFASKELPAEVGLLKRDLDDLLHDLRTAGHGKIKVVERDPADDPAARQDAQTLGIEPVQFNVYGKSELQVKEGFLGLAVQYAAGAEAIPLVRRTDDLEYRLVSSIRTLTRSKKPVVGLVDAAAPGHGTPLRAFQEQLSKSYEIRTLNPTDSLPGANVAILVLVGNPDSLPAWRAGQLNSFLEHGGSALVVAGGMELARDGPFATPRPVLWNAALKPFGISIRSDMVYDLLSNQIVPMQTSLGQVLQQYPLWVRAHSTGRASVTEEVGEVLLPWTSSLDTAGAPAGTVTPILASSRGSGLLTGETTLEPNRDFPQTDLAPRVVAAMAAAPAASRDRVGVPRGRVVAVGNGDFLSDRYAGSAPENLVLALNAVDWLAQDEALITIRSKDRRPPALAFASPGTKDNVKYGNVVGVPLLVGLLGAVRLVRRRGLTRRPYRVGAGALRTEEA